MKKKLFEVTVGESASLWTDRWYVIASSIIDADRKAKRELWKQHGRDFCVTTIKLLSDTFLS
jgi:hypothetical protein